MLTMRRITRVIVLLGASAAAILAQFSPGPLSKAHAALKGPTKCTACHVGGGGGRKFKCLGCHTDLRQRLAANAGLHPSLLGANRHEDRCIKCHSEHNGENFVPIRWDVSLDDFDHRKAGYPLEGGHARLQCNRCHNPANISPAARRAIVMKDLKRTFLGLTRECGSCHRDEHKGQFGASCERCHSDSTWKNIDKFDHASARFRLTGAHQKVACEKCHPAMPGGSIGHATVKFVGLAFAQCGACHRDPHRGSFAAPCTSCHLDTNWKPARNMLVSFDHSKTKFPLLGKHDGLACNKCHLTSDFKAPVAHEKCNDCHRDTHRGQFLTRAGGGDCAACHTADGMEAGHVHGGGARAKRVPAASGSMRPWRAPAATSPRARQPSIACRTTGAPTVIATCMTGSFGASAANPATP